MEGLQAIDRYTIRVKLNFPDSELMSNLTTSSMVAVAREVIETYGDGTGWVMANPGRHRSVPAQGMAARAEDRARGEPRLPRRALPRQQGSRRPRDRREVRGQAHPASPAASRSAIIEESNPRLLAFEQGELDYVAVPADLVWNVLDPPAKLKPRLAQRGVTLSRGIQPAITYIVLQHGRPGRRRLHAGQGRAAPRDRARPTTRRRTSASSGRDRRSRRRRSCRRA